MNVQLDPHAPRPAFRAALERKLVAEMRAQRVLPARRRAQPRWLRSAATILVALSIGAAAGAGSAQVRDNQQRDRLLEASRAELLIAQKRVELAREAAAEVQQRREMGVAGPEAAAAVEAELRAMEAELRRIELNMAEIAATGRSPRDDLAAPAVRERDFVRERLQVELRAARERLVAAERQLEQAREAERVRVAPPRRILEARVEAAHAQAEFELLAGRSELREEALARQIEAEELARRSARLELETRLRLVRQLRELSERQLEIARQRHQVGALDRIELLRLELDAAEQDAEFQRLRGELEALGG